MVVATVDKKTILVLLPLQVIENTACQMVEADAINFLGSK